VRRLPVGAALGILEEGHERQPPGRFGGLPRGREEVGELLIREQRAEIIAHPQVRITAAEGLPRYAGRLRGDRNVSTGTQAHRRTPLSLEVMHYQEVLSAAALRITSDSPAGSSLPASPRLPSGRRHPCLHPPHPARAESE